MVLTHFPSLSKRKIANSQKPQNNTELFNYSSFMAIEFWIVFEANLKSLYRGALSGTVTSHNFLSY